MQRTEPDTATRTPSERPGETTLGGRYRLLRQLGAGGMGRVYEAENVRTGRHFAVKVLDASRSADSAQVARFLQEARSAARIVHPNVVDVIDLDRDGDALYIVQELLVGEDLEATLASRGPLSPEEVVHIAVPALRGLAHAHEKGIVHRDIKPSNVFLAREGDGSVVPKIIDFGISKMTGEGPAMVLTTTGEIFGTPAYMSPEQLRGARNVDARADVWAFGVLLYECLSGALPVESDNYNVLVHEVLSGRRRQLLEAAPEVPPSLAEVVMRALAMDPDERYPHAGALLDALTPFTSTLRPTAPHRAIAAAPTQLEPEVPAATATPPRRRHWVLLGCAAALVPVLFYVLRPERPSLRASEPALSPAPVRATLVPTPASPPVVPAPPREAQAPLPVVLATADAGAGPSRSTRRHRHLRVAVEAPVAPAPAAPAAPAPRDSHLRPGGAYPGP